MPRWIRITSSVLLGVLVLLVIAISMTVGWRPFIGPRARAVSERRFESTAERLERGRYLVNGVTGCLGCHSDQDANAPGYPPMAGSEGSGKVWTVEGMPWLVAPNITPDSETGIGGWTDDLLARAIREGIGGDGRALFPLMPYPLYQRMSDEDLASIIAYIRSLRPIRRKLPRTAVPFPLSRLINSLPKPVLGPVSPSDNRDPRARGEYLVALGACTDCHTPIFRGEPLRGLEFSGGFLLTGPAGVVASTNITPDSTGIPYYDESLFLEVLRTGHVKARRLSDLMPWWYYRQMTDEDLTAILAYLRALKPVRHIVDNSVQPTPCKLCRASHGKGEAN